MSRYDDFWKADTIREGAMRGANSRYPDLTPPPTSTRRFTWTTLAKLAALVMVVALMWTGVHLS